jgi:hypothetical protein
LVLCGGLETGESLAPERVHPVPEDADARRVELVDVPRSVPPMRDETDSLEDAQVLRDRRSADRKPGCEVAHRSRPRAEELEDLPACRIAERVEGMCVSLHLP